MGSNDPRAWAQGMGLELKPYNVKIEMRTQNSPCKIVRVTVQARTDYAALRIAKVQIVDESYKGILLKAVVYPIDNNGVLGDAALILDNTDSEGELIEGKAKEVSKTPHTSEETKTPVHGDEIFEGWAKPIEGPRPPLSLKLKETA